MKKIVTLLFFVILCNTGYTQVWKSLTGDGQMSRSAAFAINGVGYFFEGAYLQTVLSYDTATQVWAPITNYPVPNTDGTVGCSLNGLGYAGMGVQYSTFSNSFFSYNPSGSTWTALTNFPGTTRAYGVMFALDGKVYMGGGLSAGSVSNNDFYAYDPVKATWSAIASCPARGVPCDAVSFVVGDKAYVGSGGEIVSGQSVPQKDFWEYDTTSKAWTQIDSLPGRARAEASAFATCDRGFVGLGYINVPRDTNAQDFWQYTPSTGKWKQVANYTFGALNAAGAVAIGNTGYVAGGDVVFYTSANDLSSFKPIATPAFYAPTNSCTGKPIAFTDTSNYSPENWSWSFPGGTPDTSNLPNPVITYNSPGPYTVTLSAWNSCDSGTTVATNYILISPAPTRPVLPKDTAFCGNFSLPLSSGSTGFKYLWSTGDTTHNLTATTLGQYWVKILGSCDTVVSDTLTIAVDTNTILQVIPQTASICPGTGVTLKVSGGGTNFVWSPSQGLSATSGDSVVASPTVNTTYSVRGNDSIGCPGSDNNIVVTIVPAPNKPTITISVTGDSLISSAGSYNQWNFNGTAINDSTGNILIIKGHARGYYSVTVTNPANGCTTTSDSTTSINRLSAINDQLSIYPNPFNSTITVKINLSASDINQWSLQLTDVLGRILYYLPSLNYSNDINLPGLAAGMYFITVLNNTTRAVFPVVKQN